MIQKEILPLFSKVFCKQILESITDENLKTIQSFIEKLEYRKTGLIYKTVGETTENNASISNSLKVLESPELKFLKDILTYESKMFLQDYMKYDQCDFTISTSWISKTNKNETSHFHNHNNSFYSGIFYVDTNSDSGNIMFENFENKTFKINTKEKHIFNCNSYTFVPENKMLLLFPSEVHHKILDSFSNTRYSLAFNILPKGTIGESDSKIVIGDQ